MDERHNRSPKLVRLSPRKYQGSGADCAQAEIPSGILRQAARKTGSRAFDEIATRDHGIPPVTRSPVFCFDELKRTTRGGVHMIEAFSVASAHYFQDALASQARLRFDVFVRRRGLDHSSWEGLEFDEFDTPAATYLVWRCADRVVRGVARLLPTTRPYMLQSYWPHLVADGNLPSSPGIYEVTRVCVDKSVEPAIRQTIFPELLCAIQEFIAHRGGAGMIGVTREHLLAHFIRSGINWLGPASEIEGEMERAFFVSTTAIRPSLHCRKFEIPSSVLVAGPEIVTARNAA